jgi:hypothetical protein
MPLPGIAIGLQRKARSAARTGRLGKGRNAALRSEGKRSSGI